MSEKVDIYLKTMIKARAKAAVLKLRLVSLRSALPIGLIFAFEGDDDKIVYSQWIRTIRKDIVFEPFPCKGKYAVLALHETVKRDRNNLKLGVWFFVDRDYDDLANCPSDPTIFMTDEYAVENYIVTAQVLEETLKNEFHCDGMLDLRRSICASFIDLYDKFLIVTLDINRRLFVARQTGIELSQNITDQINHIAEVTLLSVSAGTKLADEVIVYASDPDHARKVAAIARFDELDPARRFRGKFAYMFFQKWLSLLCDDYRAVNSNYFRFEKTSKVRQAELVLSNLASRSKHPAGLDVFLSLVKPVTMPSSC